MKRVMVEVPYKDRTDFHRYECDGIAVEPNGVLQVWKYGTAKYEAVYAPGAWIDAYVYDDTAHAPGEGNRGPDGPQT